MTAALCQFASALSPTVGAVLSTRIVRVAVVVELPTLSGTTARSSYIPSAGVQVAGEAIGLHELPPSVDFSIVIAAVSMPEPRSLAVTESGIVPWPHWPGSSSVAAGGVLSRMTGCVSVVVLPARSVITAPSVVGPSPMVFQVAS